MKKITAVLLALALLILFAAPGFAEQEEDLFADWNKEAPALKTLIEFVETVTDETSPDYIPPADRIATFDMDGTLCGELYPTYLEYYLLERRIFCDPSYTPDAEMLEFGRMLRDHALDKSFPDGMDVLYGEHAAKAYAGLTLNEFADFVTNQLVREVDGFEGMTYADLNGREDFQRWVDSFGTLPFPNGESRAEFAARCVNAFDVIRAQTEDCAIIAHGGTIMAIMEHCAIPAGTYYDFQVKNANGFILNEDGSYHPLQA